jgi:hypothetical protein
VNKAESEIIDVVVKCEQTILLLEQNIQQFSARKNDTIKHNVEFARQSVIHCLEKTAARELDQARILADIAVLRADFASQTFEAERIESLLGEADFLELCPQWQKEAEEWLSEMQYAIEIMQNAIGAKR